MRQNFALADGRGSVADIVNALSISRRTVGGTDRAGLFDRAMGVTHVEI